MAAGADKKTLLPEEADSRYLRRLETLAIFAGSIAHDYNNALTVVLGNLSLARLEAQGNRELLDVIKDADSASVKMKKLTERLAGFARGMKVPKTRFPLKDLINRAAAKALPGFKGVFTIDFKNEALEIEADMLLIEKAIENVLVNAVEASSGSDSEISVTVENTEIREHLFFKEIELNPGSYCLIKIRDNGSGIAEGSFNNIFDPYYTSKEGRDGLGLALAYAVIKKERGFISAESEEGKGAVIKIYLPGE